MRRLCWTSLDLSAAGVASCFCLLPETDAEREELRESLADAGVRNSLAFSKLGIIGRLDFPSDIKWEADGAIHLTVTVEGQPYPVSVWFWLVECDDGTGHRFAWWNTRHDGSSSMPWS